jgi:hypothetical protein
MSALCQKRTFAGAMGMSAKWQKRTSALNQHFAGLMPQRRQVASVPFLWRRILASKIWSPATPLTRPIPEARSFFLPAFAKRFMRRRIRGLQRQLREIFANPRRTQ